MTFFTNFDRRTLPFPTVGMAPCTVPVAKRSVRRRNELGAVSRDEKTRALAPRTSGSHPRKLRRPVIPPLLGERAGVRADVFTDYSQNTDHFKSLEIHQSILKFKRRSEPFLPILGQTSGPVNFL